MAKVLVATEKPFAPLAVAKIKEVMASADYELALLEKYSDKAELLQAVADVDAIIIRSDKITSEVIGAAKNLKIVVRAGAGYDNVDLNAATEKGVVVMNTPGQNSNAVAELALGMMVYIARGLFNGKPGTELKGKILGIHAYGNVGRLIAKIAKGFGMEIFAFDPFIANAEIEKDDVKPVNSIEDLYSSCQYVSVNIPANEKTIKSIDYNLLSRMPQGGVIVNTARKEVIDEEGLIKLMEVREDLKYASDIAPDLKDEFETKFEGRCYFTPKKMGAQTAEANINAGIAAAEQIVNFLEKGDERFKVN